MSRFMHTKYQSLIPYDTSEEIESLTGYIRLNTNESPYPPSEKASAYALQASRSMNYYPDPECSALARKLSEMLNVRPSNIVFGNGSDEILHFIFMAFCERGAAFPDITYSFYRILAGFNGVDCLTVPLRDFRIDPDDYRDMNGRTIFIANPNAPTGIALELAELERIITANPESIIVIDEAYADFWGHSAIEFVHRYSNVIITRTFSKSRSMAGARLGFCVANEDIITDLRTVKNTITPYNINAMTQAAGLGALEDEEYTQKNIAEIISTRETTKKALRDMGFSVIDSCTNFLFARHERLSGKDIHSALKTKGIIVRYLHNLPAYNRITIGTPEEMNALLSALKEIIHA